MREIEFRGQSTFDKQWHYGYLDYEAHDEKYKINNGKELSFYVDSNTIGQYIGIDDKNGKKIFEGDIVRYGFECEDGTEEAIGLVYFNSADCFFCIYYNDHKGYHTDDYFSDIVFAEVIGNKYDTPELWEDNL